MKRLAMCLLLGGCVVPVPEAPVAVPVFEVGEVVKGPNGFVTIKVQFCDKLGKPCEYLVTVPSFTVRHLENELKKK